MALRQYILTVDYGDEPWCDGERQLDEAIQRGADLFIRERGGEGIPVTLEAPPDSDARVWWAAVDKS